MIKNLGRGLPIAGYVKLGLSGGKDQSGKQKPPVKLDHFEITGRERDANGTLVPDVALLKRLVLHDEIQLCGGCDRSRELAKRYGIPELAEGLPTEIPVLMNYEDLELNLWASYAWFRGNTLFCRGDGEIAQRRSELKDENGKVTGFGPLGDYDGPCASGGCPAPVPDAAGKKLCGPKGRLKFMIGIQQVTGAMYEFRTTSWNSLRNLQTMLEETQQTYGLIQFVPLILQANSILLSRPGGGVTRQMIASLIFKGSPAKMLEAVESILQVRAPAMERVRRLEATISREWEPTQEEVEELRAEFDFEAAVEEQEGAPSSGSPLPAPASPPAPETPAGVAQPEPKGVTPPKAEAPMEGAPPPGEPSEDAQLLEAELEQGSGLETQTPDLPDVEPDPEPAVDRALTPDEKAQLYRALEARAKAQGKTATRAEVAYLLKKVLQELQLRTTEDLRLSTLGRALEIAALVKLL